MHIETITTTAFSSVIRSDEYYQTIGQVVCVWSQIEAQLDAMVWRMLRVDETIGLCVTSQFGTMQKIYAFCALARQVCIPEGAKEIKEDDEAEIKEIYKELEAHRPERNRIVHGYWIMEMFSDAIPKRRAATARGRLAHEKPEEIELSTLHALQTNMLDTEDRILKFWKERIVPRLS